MKYIDKPTNRPNRGGFIKKYDLFKDFLFISSFIDKFDAQLLDWMQSFYIPTAEPEEQRNAAHSMGMVT